MDVKSFEKDGVRVFKVNGEINLSTSPALKKQFEQTPSAKLLIDLEQVAYVDSSGLATLVEILKKMKSKGGSLGLSGMSDKVRSLFEITKLDKLFLIVGSQDEAVNRLQ